MAGGGGGGGGGGGAAGAERKTRTPHSDVGKNKHQLIALTCELLEQTSGSSSSMSMPSQLAYTLSDA